jgi:hypothetical protein
MQQERTLDPAEKQAMTDSAILGLLTVPELSLRPWSVDEVEREIGKETTDSLNRLYGAGLIHRLDGFVWATRAAIVAEEIKA